MTAMALAPLLATALLSAPDSSLGTLDLGSRGTFALAHACTVQPRFDTTRSGKAEVLVLLSDVALDCAALDSRINPEAGAYEQAVEGGDGALLALSFLPGLERGPVSAYATAFILGQSACEGCTLAATRTGDRLQGSGATSAPLKLAEHAIRFDVRFDLPAPSAPAKGEPMAGGGEPAKAYLAYLKAFEAGDYAALQGLMAGDTARGKYGFYPDDAARSEAIRGEDKPRSMKVLQASRHGDSAILVVEFPHPWDENERAKGGVGLVLEDGTWRVREERIDLAGGMFD
jgi:hypothetical protein